MDLCAIIYAEDALASQADLLSKQFTCSSLQYTDLERSKDRELKRFLEYSIGPEDGALVFILKSSGIHLWDVSKNLRIEADFCSPTVAYRVDKGGGRKEMIAKAVGVKSPGLSVFDATAGLGGDAFILASLGCQVTMAERNPIVRVLLEAGLQTAWKHATENTDSSLLESLSRMHVLPVDAMSYLSAPPAGFIPPDVIYLDPMFPKRGKSSLVKKEMQVLQGVVGGDSDADRLFETALAVAKHRVVVKRPRIAPQLGSVSPNHTIEGKSNRYDLYHIR